MASEERKKAAFKRRMISAELLRDRWFKSLGSEERFCWMVLLTQCGCDVNGVSLDANDSMQLVTRYDAETIERIMDKFEADGKVIRDKATGESFLKNFFLYNDVAESPTDNTNIARMKAFVGYESQKIRDAISAPHGFPKILENFRNPDVQKRALFKEPKFLRDARRLGLIGEPSASEPEVQAGEESEYYAFAKEIHVGASAAALARDAAALQVVSETHDWEDVQEAVRWAAENEESWYHDKILNMISSLHRPGKDGAPKIEGLLRTYQAAARKKEAERPMSAASATFQRLVGRIA